AEAERGQVDAALHELGDTELGARAAGSAGAAAVGLGRERPGRAHDVLVGGGAEVVVGRDRRGGVLAGLATLRRGLGARGGVDAAADLVEVGRGAAAGGDPLVDLDARRLAAGPEVADHEDVATAARRARRVVAGEGAVAVGIRPDRGDGRLEEPEAHDRVAAVGEAVGPEVEQDALGRRAGAAALASALVDLVLGRHGVLDVVLVLDRRDVGFLPQPARADVVDVLGAATGQDAVAGPGKGAQQGRVGDERGGLGAVGAGKDGGPIVAARWLRLRVRRVGRIDARGGIALELE